MLCLALFSPWAGAADLIVVTDSHHPVRAPADARVIELDRAVRLEAGLSANLPADADRTTALVQQRLREGGEKLQREFATAYQGIADAWSLGVTTLPAVVLDQRYVVYGEPDVARIEAHRLDFDRSKMTCRAIANRMADIAGGQTSWDQLAEGMALKQAVASTDAVSAIDQAESNRDNNGMPWVSGSNAGGSGQRPVRVVGDVARAGYNLLNGRDATETGSIDPNTCGSNLACQTWNSPEAVATWAVRVLGEQEQRTCENCTKTQTMPSVGLTPLIQEEYETKLQTLQELVAGSRPTSFENLQAASSASLPITRGVIEALRDEPDQDSLARHLASEVALEKALLKRTEPAPGWSVRRAVSGRAHGYCPTTRKLVGSGAATAFSLRGVPSGTHS